MLSEEFVRQGSPIDTTDRTRYDITHGPLNRLNIEGIFLSATATDFYWDHKVRVLLFCMAGQESVAGSLIHNATLPLD